jgi:hypothetical protein
MALQRHSRNGKLVRSGRLNPAITRVGLRQRPRPELEFKWAEAMPQPCWQTYREAMHIIRNSGAPFLLGGGFALATFTGRWRDTKDIDFYVRKKDRDRVILALANEGFSDYYNTRPYDRRWIYRSVREGVIVDTIWAMANQRAQVDEQWFSYADTARIRGEDLKIVPMEEFLWCKLYIMQRDHCDWTDIFNLVYANGSRIDWDRLIERLGEDVALLSGMLTVYSWLCPKHASRLPAGLWKRLESEKKKPRPRSRRSRIKLLDSRAWFAAMQPKDQKLAI